MLSDHVQYLRVLTVLWLFSLSGMVKSLRGCRSLKLSHLSVYMRIHIQHDVVLFTVVEFAPAIQLLPE